MNGNLVPKVSAEQAEAILKKQMDGRVSGFRLVIHEEGVVLQGQALTYYAKQLAQHAAMETLGLRVLANEIAVRVRLCHGAVDHSEAE